MLSPAQPSLPISPRGLQGKSPWARSGVEDESISRLWGKWGLITSLDVDEMMDNAGRVVGRNLSHSEWSQNILDEKYRETVPGLPVPEDEEARWRGRLYN